MIRALAALLATAASALTAQTPAGVPPKPGPIAAAPYPAPQELVLPNGLRVILLEQHRQPVLSLVLTIPAGSAWDPSGREGTAELLAALTTRAAGARTAEEVAAIVEGVGGSLSASADSDVLTVQGDVVSPEAERMFQLMADAVLRPALLPQELAEARRGLAGSLAAAADDPGAVAARVFISTAYRGHPYGRRPTAASVAEIGRGDLEAFRRARVRPAGSTLVIAGDLTLPEARRLATAAFASWKGLRPAPISSLVRRPAAPGIALVHQGGSATATILVGGTALAGADSSHPALVVLARLLTADRLPRVFQERHRWSAAAGASFLRTVAPGLFQISVAVAPELADSSVREIQRLLAQLRDQPVAPEDLAAAREQVAGTVALSLQTAAQLAAATAQSQIFGLPARYPGAYRNRILGVTASQLQATARRVAPVGSVTIVVVGDGARLLKPLSALGRVRLQAADGRTLTPADVEPRDQPLALAASQTVARTDSFAILAQGTPIGLQVTAMTPAGDSLVFRERTTLGTLMDQTTTVVFTSTGVMRRASQTATVRGQDTRITVDYTGGRVRGEARVLTTGGPVQFAIDTTVPVSVVDDNAIQAILPLLRWGLNYRWSLPVFASGENRLRTLSLRAADITRVVVPAGTFECYRADLEGGPERISFYVTTAAPHRVIRIEPASSPIVFVALNP